MKLLLAMVVPLLLAVGCSSAQRAGSGSGGETVTASPKIMLVVGGLKSRLSKAELERRYQERMPQFRDVPGLVQKYYSYNEATNEWAGIYLWESEDALAAYLESDLKKSIPEAFELTGPPVIQRFDIIDVLRE